MLSERTGARFFYNIDELKKIPPVTIRADQETIDNILVQLFKGKGFHYHFANGMIVITPDKAPESGSPAIELSGRVSDYNDQPLQQASVIETATGKGVRTNEDGYFKLSATSRSTLRASYLGMQSTIVPVNGQSFVYIKLPPSDASMDEVVVNGYTTLEQQHSAAAITTIKGSSLERADLFTVDNMLQGKVPGLNINRNSTQPGAAPKIRLRGTATLLGDREPVWVIDGIITDPPVKLAAGDINSLDNVNLLSTAVIGLNPQDIERIDVLKDAAATALYGVNGGNGVIVVTTKKGAFRQPPKLTYSQMTNIVLAPSYHRFNLMNGEERRALSKEIIDDHLTYFNDILPAASFDRAYLDYTQKTITPEEYARQEQLNSTINTDWFDLLFHNGVNQAYNLSVKGGGPAMAYYGSLGYGSQDGPAIFTHARRYSSLLHLDSRPAPHLQIGLKLSSSLNKGEYPYQADPFQYAYQTARSLPFAINGQRQYYVPSSFGPNESILGFPVQPDQLAGFNIMTELENSRNTVEVRSYDAVMNADWKPGKHFQVHGLYGWAASTSQNASHAGENTWYIAEKYRTFLAAGQPFTDGMKASIILPGGGEYQETAVSRHAYTIRHSLDYTITKGPHYIQAIAGNEWRQTRYDTKKMFILGYYPEVGKTAFPPPENEYPLYNAFFATGDHLPSENSYDLYRQLSWYGMLVYTFRDRYTLNGNARQDGSNSFSGDNGNAFQRTWSAAFRWGISEEPWFPAGKNPGRLALRLSYGYNDGMPETLSPRLTITPPVTDPVSGQQQATVASFANPALHWEKTRTLNGGFDFSLFHNRLYGTAEAYYKQSTGLAAPIDVPETNGVSSFTLNRADLVNYGYEAALHWRIIEHKSWSWDVGANLSFNYTRTGRTNYTDPGYIGNQQNYLDGNIIKSGTDPNTLYAYKFTGLDGQGLPTFHGIYDRDYAVRPSVQEYYANIFVPTGSRLPAFDGSFTTGFRYRRWSLSAVFLVKLGYRQRLVNLYGEAGFTPNAFENASRDITQRWSHPGDEKRTNIPALSDQRGFMVYDLLTTNTIQYMPWAPAMRSALLASTPLYLMSTQLWDMYNQSDIRTVNAGHVRLSSLALQYTLCRNSKKYFFSNISGHIQGNDLLLIANRRFQGQDPELASGSMPRLPSVTLGLDLTY